MRFIIVFIFCCFTATSAWAAEALTLQESVNQGLLHAPRFQAEEAAQRASLENTSLGRAQLLPYISVNGSLKKLKQGYTYSQPANLAFLQTTVNNRATSYGIQAVQPLFDLSRWAKYKQSQQAVATASSKLALKRQQTILEIASAWLDLFRKKAAWKAAEANEKAALKLRDKMQLAFREGHASANDKLAAASHFLLAKAVLASLVGHDVRVAISPPMKMQPLPLTPATLSGWQQQAEQHGLSIRFADHKKLLAEDQYLEALGNAMPKVQLVAGWNRVKNSDGNFGGSTVHTTMVGVEVSMPLYAGGALSARRRQAVNEKVQAEYMVADAKRSTRLAIQRAWLGLHSSFNELIALQQAEYSSKQALKAAKIGFDVGLRDMYELLDSQQRFTGSQQAYADAISRYLMAWLELHAAAGTLSSDDVAEVDRALQLP